MILKAILGLSGAILGPSWAILGPSWGHLGPPWGHLGPSWGHLGAIFGHLGPSWGHLGPSWWYLGPSCSHLKATLGHLGVILGELGVILGLSWTIFRVGPRPARQAVWNLSPWPNITSSPTLHPGGRMRHVAASLLNRNGKQNCYNVAAKIVTKWGPNVLACFILLNWLLPRYYPCGACMYVHMGQRLYLMFSFIKRS